jgi:hypothetical protein
MKLLLRCCTHDAIAVQVVALLKIHHGSLGYGIKSPMGRNGVAISLE